MKETLPPNGGNASAYADKREVFVIYPTA